MTAYLALDSATEACSVALWLDGRVLERHERVDREHTQRLLPMLKSLLAEGGLAFTQLDGMACGIGPGSFAGVRIGVGVAKGLALANDVPVVGVSSLAMLAQGAMRRPSVQRVVAVIDARMREVYAGAYLRGVDGRAESCEADRVCPADQLAPLQGTGWIGVGSGWGPYRVPLGIALGVEVGEVDAPALPTAADALTLAVAALAAGRGRSADTLVPAYLRDRVALTLQEQVAARR